MPIYDFVCITCGKEQERIVKDAETIPRCKHCNCTTKKRPLSASPAFRLTGTGWYETDFKQK